MKLLIFTAIAVLAIIGAAYACDYNFCSPKECGCDSNCQDSCYGVYWYSNGVCKDCFSDGSKHCSFETRTCSQTCGAQCSQNSDCKCQDSGCVGKDYYTYAGTCSEACACACIPTISTNDPRCPVCDTNNVDCTNPACHSNPECAACDMNNPDCNSPTCASNILCLPCDSTNVNCTIPACSNNPACITCDSNNANCSLPSCSSNIACIPCDPANVNCSIPACSGNGACIQQPVISGGGSMIVSAGSGPEKPIVKPAVCGDSICSYSENCTGCPKDCLKNGEVCCDDISRVGNCCIDYDCGKGYLCNITNLCQHIEIRTVETSVCKEDWICTSMSECKLNAQTRFCVDKNDCGTINEMPDLVQSCSGETPSGMFLVDSTIIGAITSLTLLTAYLLIRRRKASEILMKTVMAEGKSDDAPSPPL
jgi:hypothetical protein